MKFLKELLNSVTAKGRGRQGPDGIYGLCALLFFILLGGPRLQAQTYRYGAYGLFPQGPSRILSMGGASATLSDDASSTVFNPAGTVMSDWQVDLKATHNRIDNDELAGDGGGDDTSKPYDFYMYAGSFRTEHFGLSLGASAPYNLETEGYDYIAGQDRKTELKIFSGDASLAVKLGENIAIGVSGHQELLTEEYVVSGVSVDSEASHFFLRGGVRAQFDELGIGIVYSPQRDFDIDETRANTEALGTTYFRDVVIPAKLTVGMSYQVREETLIAIDVDQFAAVENAIYVGSGTFSAGDEQLIEKKTQTVIHGGVEWKAIEKKTHEVILRGGYYREPARLVSAEARDHLTFGLELRFGPAVLAVAFDQADNFNNTAQGFSLSFGSI